MPLSDPENNNQISILAAFRQRALLPKDIFPLLRIAKQEYSLSELIEQLAPIDQRYVDVFANNKLISQCKRDLESWSADKIHILIRDNECFPENLCTIHDVPIILFAWGQVDAFSRFRDYLAIVGSRKADKYGLTIAEEISLVAAAQGLCVVSGLAYGVDAAAHRGALASKNTFSTIAILGSGLNKLYPPNHYALAIDIVTKGGVILSQFEPNMPPLPANFLNRNRLIAGLSSAVLVIQAPEKSGSLNTARYALEEGREVLVVPGPIYDERYRGSNLLIKQGAHVITSSNDVLEFYPNVENNRKNNLINSSNAISLDENSSKLLAMLKSSGQLHVEELKTVLTSEDEFSSLLLFLELEGYIQRLPGNYIGIKPRL